MGKSGPFQMLRLTPWIQFFYFSSSENLCPLVTSHKTDALSLHLETGFFMFFRKQFVWGIRGRIPYKSFIMNFSG